VENDLRTNPSDATVRSCIKSLSRARRAAVHIPRSRVISTGRALRSLAFAILLAPFLSAAALAAPSPAPVPTFNATHLNERLNEAAKGGPLASPKPIPAPTVPLHTEFVVETNRLGQITRVRSGKESKDLHFNAMTYGNVLQAFIRKPDGTAVAGVYRMTYDYDPTTTNVKRGVSLISAGGVDPNAKGAVNDMADINKARAEREAKKPSPKP
jgi:hypothetical protein